MTGETYRSVGLRGVEIAGLTPAFTITGGRAVYDPHGSLGA